MKRILVIDDSRAIRETLGLILGQKFTVVHRSSLAGENASYPGDKVDLLIIGCSPGLGAGPSAFLRISTRFPCPVLFLVDSENIVGLTGRGRVDYLVKPFNPYELREKVARLLAQVDNEPTLSPPSFSKDRELSRFLDFPYLPQSTAALARRFAVGSFPVLIIGEMGCGQEQVARAIFSLNRNAGPWVSVYPPEMSEECLAGRVAHLPGWEEGKPQPATLFLDRPETLSPLSQASLLRFLEKESERGRNLWILTGSRVDLLEKVFRGEFLDLLYRRLAALTLWLPPLRERQGDLPSLAAELAQDLGERLDLGSVVISPGAIDRLRNYLWFGNIMELEAVISRTLVTHRKAYIEAHDVILEVGDRRNVSLSPGAEREVTPAAIEEKKTISHAAQEGKDPLSNTGSGNGGFPDIKILMTELAHELKNPMVTIKTFAHLLAERFDDVTFRTHFQETVGDDIKRMDGVLESLLEFLKFNRPLIQATRVYDPLRHAVEEIVPECISKETMIRWGRKGEEEEVFVDQEQFQYACRNILQTVVGEVKPRDEIQIDVEERGRISITYFREGAGMRLSSLYLGSSSSAAREEIMPLRILLAKNLVERIGGDIEGEYLSEGKVRFKIMLPVNRQEIKEERL
jgi:DNA-binding NtrC family response regulator